MPLKDLEKTEVICLVDNNVDILLPNTQLAYRPSLGKDWFERFTNSRTWLFYSVKIGNKRKKS